MLLYANAIEGFTHKVSYSVGETIEFKVRSATNFSIFISKIESPKEILLEINNIQQKNQAMNTKPFLGVEWETCISIEIPQNWESGVYSAELKNDFEKSFAFFTIKGTGKELAVLASTNTWQAYNFWGDACFYNINDSKIASTISYNRPLLSTIPSVIASSLKETPFGKKHVMNCERLLFKWMKGKYSYDVIAEPDLPLDLRYYKILVIGFHSEYWSEEMYNSLLNFIENKGKIIYLGGNALYWKIYQKDRFIKCNKANRETWRRLNKPESSILGIQYTDTDYKSMSHYQLRANNHWIFNKSGLNKGDYFGENASGWETDKTSMFTPDGTILLAKGMNENGGAEMVYRDGIFSVGSVTYTLALDDPIISHITKNVFNAFLAYDIAQL